MSLSARHVLRRACRISLLPSPPRSATVTEPAYRDERVEPAVSNVSQTSQVEHVLINGAEHSPEQCVETVAYFNRVFYLCVDKYNHKQKGLMSF